MDPVRPSMVYPATRGEKAAHLHHGATSEPDHSQNWNGHSDPGMVYEQRQDCLLPGTYFGENG